jgi:hypothetical protein
MAKHITLTIKWKLQKHRRRNKYKIKKIDEIKIVDDNT